MGIRGRERICKLSLKVTMISKPAFGKKGFLIWAGGHKYYFRIYDGKDFTDYDLLHSDMEIIINDENAFLYEDKVKGNSIDHSPSSLGLNPLDYSS